MDDASKFYVMVNGQLEAAEFGGYSRIFAKVNFVHNADGVEDWQVIQGSETGITQIACASPDGDAAVFALNYPLEVGYSTTNASGWPRIIVSVFGVNALGSHVLAGYGVIHVPMAAGRYVKYVRTFKPASASLWQWLTSMLYGDPPEFLNIAKVLGEGTGREVARVESSGVVKFELNVTTKHMATYGYTEASGSGVITSM
eukprot:c9423_g1_i1.p2 GENE.c9423_g1_i1~~c9423_g1_i1.p2  ORF type:complete len:212 (+),score=35.71 c9423_g1_i1:38-637(+)